MPPTGRGRENLVAVADLSNSDHGREDETGALAIVLGGAFRMIENRKPGYRLIEGGERGSAPLTLSATR